MQTTSGSLSARDRTRAGVVAFVIAVLFATSCGASAEVEVSDNAAGSATTQTQDTADTDTAGDTGDTEAQAVEPTPVPETETDTAEPADAGDQPESSPRIAEGTFELVLENGETFNAPVLCVLDPQIAAGSEILFTATGQNDSQFVDVTQWGETAFGGTQDVEVVESTTFDSLWRATGSTGLELELSGDVITGSGGFYAGEEFSGPYTQGDLTVTC